MVMGTAVGTHTANIKRPQFLYPNISLALGRPRRRWEDGIKMDLGEISSGGGGCVEWIHLAQDRYHRRALVNAVMNLRVLAPRS
jgi:hypothetical protein